MENLDVSQISGDILLEAGDSYLALNSKGIEIGAPDGFQVISPKSGAKIFPPDFGRLSLPGTLTSLTVPGGAKNVHKIRSPIDQDLRIVAKERIKVKGNEGIKMNGKELTFQANGLFLAAINGSLILDARGGVVLKLDTMDNYPRREGEERSTALQYKLCICAKSGRVFKLHMKSVHNTCGDVRFPESINPCH